MDLDLKLIKKNDGSHLGFMEPEQITLVHVNEALEKGIVNIKYVPLKFQTKEMWEKCLKINANLLSFINKDSKILDSKLALIAVTVDGLALKLIPSPFKTNKVLHQAVTQNGLALSFVSKKKQTKELCDIAFNNNHSAYWSISNPEFLTLDMAKKAIKKDPTYYTRLDEKFKTPELINIALKSDGRVLNHIDSQTVDQCIIALKSKLEAYIYVKIMDNPNGKQTLKNLELKKQVLDGL